MKNKAEFWIKNVTKKNISLSDLALIVPVGRSWNLLDSKHFSYTLEQLEESAVKGSLFKKSDRIKIRNVPPDKPVTPGIYVSNDFRNKIPRSLLKIEDKKYEELEISDEKYAEEFAALDVKSSEDNVFRK